MRIAACALSLYLTNATPLPATLPVTDSAAVFQARGVLPSFGDLTSSGLVSPELQLSNSVTINVLDVPGHITGSTSIFGRSHDQEMDLYRRSPHTYTLETNVGEMYLALEMNPIHFEHELAEDIIASLKSPSTNVGDYRKQRYKMFYCLWFSKILVGYGQGIPERQLAIEVLKKWEDAALDARFMMTSATGVRHASGIDNQNDLLERIAGRLGHIHFLAQQEPKNWMNHDNKMRWRNLVRDLLILKIENLHQVVASLRTLVSSLYEIPGADDKVTP
ncbi:hypothetical protein H0H93_015157, partial [Arthromyces matolae]